MADEKNPVILGVLDYLFKLSWNRVLLIIAAVFCYYAYENRDRVFSTFFASTPLMASAGVGVVLLLIGVAFAFLLNRIDEMNKNQLDRLNGEVVDLKKQIVDVSSDRRADTLTSYTTILAALGRIEDHTRNIK